MDIIFAVAVAGLCQYMLVAEDRLDAGVALLISFAIGALVFLAAHH